MFFFFIDTPPPSIYPLSLHDALPICPTGSVAVSGAAIGDALGRAAVRVVKITGSLRTFAGVAGPTIAKVRDRKSTRLNSSHVEISYAVFCLKKKKKKKNK